MVDYDHSVSVNERIPTGYDGDSSQRNLKRKDMSKNCQNLGMF